MCTCITANVSPENQELHIKALLLANFFISETKFYVHVRTFAKSQSFLEGLSIPSPNPLGTEPQGQVFGLMSGILIFVG